MGRQFAFVLPVARSQAIISRGYSRTNVPNPVTRTSRPHQGIDFAPVVRGRNIAVFSSESGEVVYSRRQGPTNSQGFGNLVIVYHGQNTVGKHVYSYYAHLSSTSVSDGDAVERGQSLGLMGTTGGSSGVHLHYSVHESDKKIPVHSGVDGPSLGQTEGATAVNPGTYLSPDQLPPSSRGGPTGGDDAEDIVGDYVFDALENAEQGSSLEDTLRQVSRVIPFSQLGVVFGSAIGRQLGGTDPLQRAVFSTGLAAVLQTLGETLDDSLVGKASGPRAFENVLGTDSPFVNNLAAAGIGAISSYLTAELVNAVGLDGIAGEVANGTAGAVVGQIATNIVNGAGNIFAGIEAINLGNIIGSWAGAKLAAELVSFDTIGGQLGASLGASLGSIAALSQIVGLVAAAPGTTAALASLGAFAGPVGALAGAFLGFIVGGLIGSLFGGTPRSGADVEWDAAEAEFVVANVSARKGGSKEAAISLAEAVASGLNGIVTATGAALIDADSVNAGNYGMIKKDYVLRNVGGGAGVDNAIARFNSSGEDAAAELIDLGSYHALQSLRPRLAGGDVYAKRALATTLDMASGNPNSRGPGSDGDFSMTTLSGNLTTAADYARYLRSSIAIDALIVSEPESVFATGWAVTFARTVELGLNKRASTDWAGGFGAWLDALEDGAINDGTGTSASGVQGYFDQINGERIWLVSNAQGEFLGTVDDTVQLADKDIITGTALADTIVVSGAVIANAEGLTINGLAASGAQTIKVAAVISGGDGNDVLKGGDLGNDLIGGGGNDTLYGGRLDDWLLGGDGNDALNAGGDTGGLGGDGNYLDGGAGDDFLIGREGSDWIEGGDGTDILEGGGGDDVLAGGRGIRDISRGGGGNDQYVFRVGDVADSDLADADVIRDESGLTLQTLVGQAYADQDATTRATTITAALSGALFKSGRGLGNWQGGGAQLQADGAQSGGEDVLVLGPGIGLDDIGLKKSADGKDLIVEIDKRGTPITDRIVLADWFNPFNRIETLRFADGNELRIADFDTFILGSDASEVLIGTPGNDFVYAGEGDDRVYLFAGNDFGNGGGGNDAVSGDSGNDIVVGSDGDDVTLGGRGTDNVSGGRGDDQVGGGDDADIVTGGQGSDTIVGGGGDDVFKYIRGDGKDVFIDAYTSSWETVWISGKGFQPYYSYGGADDLSILFSNELHSEVVFDGSAWTTPIDYDVESGILRRNALATVGSNGNDVIEFGIGIDINDIQFRASLDGKDLLVGIETNGARAARFEDFGDQITLKEWGAAGTAGAKGSIESFVFFNTGSVDVKLTQLIGGTDGNDGSLSGSANKLNWITGGSGDDNITGQALNDILNGNDGSDTLTGAAGNDVLLGGGGNDTLNGGGGSDTLVGGEGFDTASYAAAGAAVRASLLNPKLATDTIAGGAAGDIYSDVEGLEGSGLGDELEGDNSDNDLAGRKGNDVVSGNLGNDTYVFGRADGVDTIDDRYGAEDELVVDANGTLLAPYVASVELIARDGATYNYRHIVTDSESGAVIYDKAFASTSSNPIPPAFDAGSWARDAQDNPVYTFEGSKVFIRAISGNAGDDVLYMDDYTGKSGYTGNHSIGLSDLKFRFDAGANANDLLVEIIGSGGEQARLKNFRSGAAAATDTAIETLQLSDGEFATLSRLKFDANGQLLLESSDTEALPVDDFIVDTSVNGSLLRGRYGADVISGLDGNDTLEGGEGNDLLSGGAGADVLDGGAGIDSVSYFGSDTAVTASLVTMIASGGEAGAGTLKDSFISVENLIGSDFNDNFTGDSLDNILKGNRGNDRLTGASGRDVLIGDEGTDTLSGGLHDDNIDGGLDNDDLDGGGDRDILNGGDGNDTLRGDGVSGADAGGNLVSMLTTGVLETATENVLVSEAVNGLTEGEIVDLRYNYTSAAAGAAGSFEVLWNGAVVATVIDGTATLKTSTTQSLVAIRGENILGFRGAATTADGLAATVSAISLARPAGGADQLIGGAGVDRLEGGNGNDVLVGGDGDDNAAGGLYGGLGNDTLDGGAGHDFLNGGAGHDTYLFDAASGQDVIVTGGGYDDIVLSNLVTTQIWLSQPATTQDLLISVIGGASSVRVQGWFEADAGKARRIIVGDKIVARADIAALMAAMTAASTSVPLAWPVGVAALDDAMAASWQSASAYLDRARVQGGTDNDTLGPDPVLAGGYVFEGFNGNDSITGSNVADIIYGQSGDDTIVAGGGDDSIRYLSGTGHDSVDGGAGNDELKADADGAQINLRSLTDVERIAGDDKANVVINIAANAALDFTAVTIEDIVQINGNDTGSESIVGSVGDDRMFGLGGADTLHGGLGADHIAPGTGLDAADGGGGNDTIDLSLGTPNILSFDMASGVAAYSSGSETLANFENAIGTASADVILGTAETNVIDGGAGIDRLEGRDGNDVLIGGAGADILKGGAGSDTVSYRTQALASTTTSVQAGITIDGVVFDLENNSATGSGTTGPTNRGAQGDATGDWSFQVENLEGSRFGDFLTGDAAANRLDGGIGSDVLHGGLGNDTIIGGQGNDQIEGGSGVDTIAYAANRADYEVIVNNNVVTVRDLVLSNGDDGTDTIMAESGDKVQFADVTAEFGVSVNNNVAPILGQPGVTDQVIDDTATFLYQLPLNSFIDLNLDDTMTLSARFSDGTAIAENAGWLRFAPGTRTFSADSYPAVNQSYTIEVTATDGLGLATTTSFELLVREGAGVPILGTPSADTLGGSSRGEVITGYDGNDTLRGKGGADQLDGGDGSDTAYYDAIGAVAGVRVDLAQGRGFGGDAEGDTLVNIENVFGSIWGDTLVGSTDQNVLTGDDGDDTLDGGDGDDQLFGGAGVDSLSGGNQDDTLSVRVNADGSLEDFVDGGQGDDTLDLSLATVAVTSFDLRAEDPKIVGIEHVTGTNFADGVIGSAYANTLRGRQGADTLTGWLGGDALYGDGDNDILYGDEGVLTPEFAFIGDDQLDGGDGDDTLHGQGGNDLLYGRLGDDRLIGGAGADSMYGGDGTDVIDYTASNAGVTVNLGSGILGDLDPYSAKGGTAELDRLGISVEDVDGSGYGDTIVGSYFANRLQGFAGADSLFGGAGEDLLDGGAGADTLDGGDSGDIIRGGTENDSLIGGGGIDQLAGDDGNDTLIGGAGADIIDGGLGDDLIIATVIGEDSINGGGQITTTLTAGSASGDILDLSGSLKAIFVDFAIPAHKVIGIETVIGTVLNDSIHAGPANISNKLIGGEGNDTLEGGLGGDILIGGNGTDLATYVNSTQITSGAISLTGLGAVFVNGVRIVAPVSRTIDGVDVNLIKNTSANGSSAPSAANRGKLGDADGDWFIGVENLQGSTFSDRLFGDAGANLIGANAGDDVVDAGAGDDTINGLAGDDILIGGDGVDIISASEGDDRLFGGAGTDFLYGHDGRDVIEAGDGGDLLVGGNGNDTLIGGEGADVYSIGIGSGQDVIYNYSVDRAPDAISFGNAVRYTNLWFSKVAGTKDLKVEHLNDPISGLPNTSNVTVKDWFTNATANDFESDRNFTVNMFLSEDNVLDGEEWRGNYRVGLAQLLPLMVGSKPALYSDLTPANQTAIANVWKINDAPAVQITGDAILDTVEDQPLTVRFTVTDETSVGVTFDVRNPVGFQAFNAATDVTVVDQVTRDIILRPLTNFKGAGRVEVVAIDELGKPSAPTALNITVRAVADGAEVTAPLSYHRNIGSPIALVGSLTGGSLAILEDSSEQFAEVTIAGVPVGVVISDGVNSATAVTNNTSIDVTGWNLSAIQLIPASGSAADFVLTLNVRTRDGSVISGTTSRAIDVRVNGAPTDFTLTMNGNEVLTPLATDTAVGFIGNIVDQGDTGGAYSYVITNGPPKLAIDGNTLMLKSGSTLTVAENALISVRIIDHSSGISLNGIEKLNVAVTPQFANKKPSQPTYGANANLNENTGGRISNLSLATTDLQGDFDRFVITQNPGNWFEIDPTDGSKIRVRSGQTVNFENNSVVTGGAVTIRVVARDLLGHESDFTDIPVAINNLNDAPVITSPGTSITLNEASATNAWYQDLAAIDEDGHAIVWDVANNPGNLFQIVGSRLRLVAPLDYENLSVPAFGASRGPAFGSIGTTAPVTVRATSGGQSVTQQIAFTLSDSDEPLTPMTGVAPVRVAENAAGVGLATLSGAADPENAADIDYFFALGGNPGGNFSIVQTAGATAELRLQSPFDHESYSAFQEDAGGRYVTVHVVGQLVGSSATSPASSIKVYINNLNDNAPLAPAYLSDGVSAVTEAAGAATVATLTSSDPDGGLPSMELVGSDAGYFTLEQVGSEWTVKTRANIDADIPYRTSLTAQVQANDGTNYSSIWSKTITLGNVDDNLPVAGGINMSNGFGTTIVENSVTPGLSFAIGSASDADGDALTFSILSASGTRPADDIFVVDYYDEYGYPQGHYEYVPETEIDISGLIGSVFAVTSSGSVYSPNGLSYAALATAIGTNDTLDVDPNLAISLNIRVSQANNVSRSADFQTLRFNVADILSELQVYDGTRDLFSDLPSTYRNVINTLGFYTGDINNPGYGFHYDKDVDLFDTDRYRRIYKDYDRDTRIINGDDSIDTVIAYSKDGARTDPYPYYGYHWGAGLKWATVLMKALPPLVLDLDGDGVMASDTLVSFDVDLDGKKDLSGWINAGDGFLVLDKDGNGKIDNALELSFMYDNPDATSDLEGLRAYDTNNDLVFDNRDARFGEVQIWQDNGNAITDAGELTTLSARGITAIDLRGVKNYEDGPAKANTVLLGSSRFTKANGTTGRVADIALRWTEDPNGAQVTHGAAALASVAAFKDAAREAGETDRGSVSAAPTLPASKNPSESAKPATAAPVPSGSFDAASAPDERRSDIVAVNAVEATETHQLPGAPSHSLSNSLGGPQAASSTQAPISRSPSLPTTAEGPPDAEAKTVAPPQTSEVMILARQARVAPEDNPEAKAAVVGPATIDLRAAGLQSQVTTGRRPFESQSLASLIDRFSTDTLGRSIPEPQLRQPQSSGNLIKFLDQMAAFHGGAGLMTTDTLVAKHANPAEQIAQLAAGR